MNVQVLQNLSTLAVYNNVISVSVSDRDTPTVQVIYTTEDTIHVDTYQSKDITSVAITITIPEG